ncbi:hypothetical protein PsYK624_171740 [Phanerochaete sordida]|uniref:Uncharacterized protein n=1 Tax=Phanerochaete sordida TaxID=48140 RepID=A0A9P3LMU1_9APHY|nr:hypothetical protein PsYK624_171740 [Phanerochaete sordida]
MPAWVARLPKNVGYPAGGSLTSDEWKALLLVYGPIVIPLIWNEWEEPAEAIYQTKVQAWKKGKEKRKPDDNKASESQPKRRMHPKDADNFLAFSAAMKILLARSIHVDDLPPAQHLFQSYLDGFYQMHRSHIKPNHHYVTHIFEQIPDYGPVYNFWTYLFERLNKVLKSYASNNHSGGVIEVTFMREFSREVRLRAMLDELARGPEENAEGSLLAMTSRLLLRHEESRGTVSDLAQESAGLAQEMATSFAMGPGPRRFLSLDQQQQLIQAYRHAFPAIPLVLSTDPNPPRNAHYFNSGAIHHEYLVLHGRRITPSRFDGHASNSIIQRNFNGRRYVGEVMVILSHTQPTGPDKTIQLYLLGVRWFRRASFDTSPWDGYPELEVLFWKFNEYLNPDREGPPFFLLPDEILSQAARLTLLTPSKHHNDDDETLLADQPNPQRKIWATCGLTKDVIVM